MLLIASGAVAWLRAPFTSAYRRIYSHVDWFAHLDMEQ